MLGLSDSENYTIMIAASKTMTIHDYEYYHNSYMVSVSVHKYRRQRNMHTVVDYCQCQITFILRFHKIIGVLYKNV